MVLHLLMILSCSVRLVNTLQRQLLKILVFGTRNACYNLKDNFFNLKFQFNYSLEKK